MTKQQLLYEINRLNEMIRNEQSKLSESEKDLEALESFEATSRNRISAFEASVSRRKIKLAGLSGLLATVKAAARYQKKMSDMLNGREYQNVVSQIDDLQRAVSTQKSTVKGRIIELKDNISYYKRRVTQLKYEYDHYPEEVDQDE